MPYTVIDKYSNSGTIYGEDGEKGQTLFFSTSSTSGGTVTISDTQVAYGEDNDIVGNSGFTYDVDTGALSVAGSTVGQSTINLGLVVNNGSGVGSNSDFTVKTGTQSEAFTINASADTVTFNVPVYLNDNTLQFPNFKIYDNTTALYFYEGTTLSFFIDAGGNQSRTLKPIATDTYELGYSNRNWTNLHLSGSIMNGSVEMIDLSDTGTTSILTNLSVSGIIKQTSLTLYNDATTTTYGFYFLNGSGSTIDLTMKDPTTSLDDEITIKCIDSTNAVNVIGTIDDMSSINLTAYDSITLKSNGTQWYII